MSNRFANRILIVDDNRAIHDDFRKILCPERDTIDAEEAEFFGGAAPTPWQPVFEIESAYQGRDGVAAAERAMAENQPYAMAFVDVRMPPGIDGIETVELLWKISPDLHVVICTAHSDYSWQEMIDRLGCPDRLLVLKKPFASIEALQLAGALCEKWQLTREAGAHLAETERVVEERTRELREANQRLEREMGQRQQAEAQLLRAQRLESIGTLASGIAHDLNNMLSPILMSVGLLRAELPDTAQELTATIESCAERAAGVVKQVLTFARGIGGERVPVQPRRLVREMEKIASETFPRQIAIETFVPADLPLIEGDATQMHQVLLNLCVNARDAMPDGGTLRIEADTFQVDEHYASMTPGARAGEYVRLQVSDTGTGIPQHLIEKIFDPFFTTKPLGKGTGLGLSTVVGIVQSHHGFIVVRSDLGRGTTFEIFVPATQCDGAPNPQREEVAGPDGKGQLILVVDDELAIRSVTEATLTQHGYRTLVAADGAEAISLYARQTEPIDAVFTDVMMPLVDGVALCRALKKMDPLVRIIASTGAAEEGRRQELQALNIGHVLGKPFSSDTLLAALDETLSSPQASLGPRQETLPAHPGAAR